MLRKTKFAKWNGYWFWAASFDGNALHNWFPERDQMLAVESRRFMLSIAMANWTQYVRYSFFLFIRCLLDSIHCCCLVCYPCGNAEWFTFNSARSVSTSQHPTHWGRESESTPLIVIIVIITNEANAVQSMHCLSHCSMSNTQMNLFWEKKKKKQNLE